MNILYFLVAIILLVFIIWCILLIPRRKHPGWTKLDGYLYAHRGLHDLEHGIPENSMTAFRAAVEHGFGAELDVHLMADGNLAVVHDSKLTRLCGRDERIEDLRLEDLKDYPLLGGDDETIPLLADVLEVFAGKTPLIVELKVVDGNTAALTDSTMKVLDQYPDLSYCIESFHPSVVAHLKKHYPNVIRGQLSENFMKSGNSMPRWQAFVMTWLLLTNFTRPDFIAYRWKDRSIPSLRLMRALYGVREVSWTVREKSVMDKLVKDGCMVIFEKFIP